MPKQSLTIASAVARGVAGYQRGSEARKEAQDKQKRQDIALQQSQKQIASQPTVDQAQEQNRLQLEKLQNENQAMRGEAAQTNLVQAMDVDEANGNFKNTVDILKNNPHFQKLYAPLANMQPMNIGSNSDLRLLEPIRQERMEQLGLVEPIDPKDPTVGPPEENLEEAAEFWQENPELLKNQVKTIGVDGSESGMDWREFKARNLGYANKTDDAIKSEMDKVKLETDKYKLSRIQKGLSSTPTQEESDIKTFAKLTPKTEEEVGAGLLQKKLSGVKGGQADLANDTTTKLHDKFGGEDKFFATDFSDPKNKRTAAAEIRKIVNLTGGLDKADEKELRLAGQLMSLASSVAGGLTPESAGIVDNLVNTGRDFFFSNVVDAKRQAAEASYLQFNGLLRKAFAGTAVTPVEMINVKRDMGALTQKLPAVITKFKSNIEKIQANLSVLSDYQDPTLAHYYTGSSQEKVNKVLSQLDNILVGLGADPKDLKSTAPAAEAKGTAKQDRFNKFFPKKESK